MIAVAGFTIAYVVKKDFLPQTASTQKTQKTNNTQTTHIPPDWKTYTDSDFHLQFAYPATDAIQTKSYGFNVSSITLQTSKNNTDFQLLLLPKSLADAVGQNFDDYYTMSDNTTKTIKNPISQDNTMEKFTKISNRTIDGNRALDYQSIASNAKPGTKPEIGTFVEVGSNLVLISTSANNKTNLDRMLETFQYTQ